MDKMKGMMENLRKDPIKELAGKKVAKVIDYLDTAATGLPKANVLTYEMEDGSSVIIRPSGTEPKIKFYTEVKDASFKGAADYERCTKAAEEKIEAIKKSLNL
jgi:phosphoglucomutase